MNHSKNSSGVALGLGRAFIELIGSDILNIPQVILDSEVSAVVNVRFSVIDYLYCSV